jgi:hypothetical protein
LWDILRSVALMLGVSKLLAMANDIGGLHPIVISEVFLWLISCSIVYNFRGHFKSTYSPINLEYWSLEAMKPSLLAFEPSLTYTLIGPWCKLMLKTFLITFLELLFVNNYVMLGRPLMNFIFFTKLFYGVHSSLYYQDGQHVEGVNIIESSSSTKHEIL